MSDEPIKEDPVKKFRKLMGSLSPLARLPKRSGESESFLPKQSKEEKDTPKTEESPSPKVRSGKDKSASKPKASNGLPVSESLSQPGQPPEPVAEPKPRASFFGPRFWTTASVISLTINIIITIILIILVISVYRLKLDINKILDVSTSLMDLPGGLYENFEKMDRASIQTNVKVETSIPVKFDLALNQQTNVVLSQDVTINNARVTVNTGGLNIAQANTTIILPQGTTLPVLLNLTVPVDTTVPVVLDVPVNIPLSQTELNEPFVGLQEVIKPLYCFMDPEATNVDGQPICE